ncbi:IS66 family transposase [Macellibacteroides fermentans]|uniref:Putative coiled-coil protein SlyX n=1 Tax=Macellibacteroides fermentans TaxID=879969 RepID=A0A8E2A6T4_9PORP|nr:IS66 family transposase [Macellibacteroides fermentans]NYI49364.1 putative coiled-coil protein SlyX [Macellibacteroides fermentans]NYI49958.1 putative coiled-coil protein SlyX [Macellibacteroides fermentans]NYI49961.1 putative coiled-coil protein SlyX [Macellibacteroides fermentans]NYI50408.1 putative coiled-coil protein SlyX [Macellibacteroides fermentans]
MNSKRIIELQEDQLKLSAQREKMYLEQLVRQSEQIERLSVQVGSLTETIRSLEKSLLQKNGDMQKVEGKNRRMSKLLSNKSEKLVPDTAKEEPTETAPPVLPKDRGNNNAKRKEYFSLETIVEHVYPDDPAFDKEKARVIGSVDSVMYTYSKATFKKIIYRQYNCVQQEKVYSGKAPRSPLQNSNYDASFIAGMLQLRYVYSMPVERIVKYFTENGFELNKATAHGLIKKSAGLMDRLDDVLHTAILEDDYLCMDESYHTILTKEKNKDGKGVRKGYIWAALANTKKLVQYFYENGSRSREVLTNYIGNHYKGAIQSDGLINYKILETDTYPDVIRLACFQHCKRQFLDLANDKEAIGIVNIINRLYQAEHKIDPKWKPDKILEHRQEYAPPILAELKSKLLEIQSNPSTLPKSPLSKAVNYTLNEYDALCNYIVRPDYALDNNAVERCMRSISLSRKNSLFCGSHAGAKRTALLYSLSISCKLHNINSFEYFTDILNRLAYISPTAPDQIYRDLLPDKWTKL